MEIKHIFIGFLICLLVAPSVLAAANDDELINFAGEGNSGNNNQGSSNSVSTEDDVWGIKQSGTGFESLANIKTLGGVYMGMTPFKNMSLISISIAAGLALTFVIVGIFMLLALAGVGAGHPNVKKGWELLRGAQGKMAQIGVVFALALFVIILVFFSITLFGKVIGMVA